jgi:hypothetical protein
MRFRDGKMSLVGNVETVESKVAGLPVARGNFTVLRGLFGWPLPELLCTLCHPGLVENAAMWPQGDPGDLPAEIAESPNVEVYVKVSESQLPDDSMSHVMRGAEYQLLPLP